MLHLKQFVPIYCRSIMIPICKEINEVIITLSPKGQEQLFLCRNIKVRLFLIMNIFGAVCQNHMLYLVNQTHSGDVSRVGGKVCKTFQPFCRLVLYLKQSILLFYVTKQEQNGTYDIRQGFCSNVHVKLQKIVLRYFYLKREVYLIT